MEIALGLIWRNIYFDVFLIKLHLIFTRLPKQTIDSVFFIMSSSSMLNSYQNGSMKINGYQGLNGKNGFETNGKSFENGNSTNGNNYKKNGRNSYSTHEAIVTRKCIKEPDMLTIFRESEGLNHPTKALPLPPFEGMPVPIPGGFCEKSGTSVIFDEEVHLNLGKVCSITYF